MLIDPFITGNPLASCTVDDIPKLDYILISHDHSDHFGPDVLALAKRDGATLIAIFDITQRADVVAAGIQTVGMNIGGTFEKEGISVSLTQAVHSSEHGNSVGLVVRMDGVTVYHAGDTGLFSDMALIPELCGALDVALLPIGGHFTMDEAAAAKATMLLKPKLAIPIHYNTFPQISADPARFTSLCQGCAVRVLEPGQSVEV